jgi:hypothetical protein
MSDLRNSLFWKIQSCSAGSIRAAKIRRRHALARIFRDNTSGLQSFDSKGFLLAYA